MEKTLVLVKPDGVERNLIGEVIQRIERRNLRIAGLKMIRADRKVVEEHYAEHKGKPFFESTCDYLVSGPIVAMVVEGVNAVKTIRVMMGATNPVDAAPGTVRGDFALSIEANIVHSSGDAEAAERELRLWFPEALPC
jgi:nucleoside-diphosphate kinase